MPVGRREVDAEDHVEALVAEVDLLERGAQEGRSSARDVLGVSGRRGGDHLWRAVDRDEAPAAGEALAHERRRHTVAAAELEHALVGPERERLDRGRLSR